MTVNDLIELLEKVQTKDAKVYLGEAKDRNIADTVIVHHDMSYMNSEGVIVVIKGTFNEI